MKRLTFGFVPLLVMATLGSAVAADMPIRRTVSAPVTPPSFNWGGCYVGGYVGGAWSDSNGATFSDQGQNGLGAAGSVATPPFQSYSGGVVGARAVSTHSFSDDLGSSFIGGGTLGCNWQPAGASYVLGIEGEIGYLRLRGSAFDPSTIAGTQSILDVQGSAKAGDWYGMLTGRLGYNAWERTLLYVKGGAAFIPTRTSVVDACQSAGCGNWLVSTSTSNTITTWTFGGGLEWAYNANWSIKAEYMFIAAGEDSGTQSCGSAIAPSGSAVAGGPFCFNSAFNGIHTAKVGLNYRLGSTGF